MVHLDLSSSGLHKLTSGGDAGLQTGASDLPANQKGQKTDFYKNWKSDKYGSS